MNEADDFSQNANPKPAVTRGDGNGTDPGATLDGSHAPGLSIAEHSQQEKSIGPYRLVRRLGEGGMGQVWLAEQTEPIRRQVALKLIKVGRYDDSVLQRFFAERQSLALMDHPAIAKVFDAGSTSDGQPYFVMEYVPGQPITDYCDRKRLKIRERLELLIKVCEGVQHAHQKAVMHRDLKPANILVVEVDGKPVPRIIDFGLAKPVSPSLDGETLFTQAGGWVGTPGYMSPEQADPSVIDVDTRTDVYSLGAVLYVLLTGCLPFETKDSRKVRFDEFLRRLREEDPPRPSTKISMQKHSSSAASEARATVPQQLVRTLHGDLDWIAVKALEKERSRRYASASEFAADLQRYLKNEPVLAAPPSLAYRAGKFARRYRIPLATAGAFTAVLIAATAFSIRQSIRANREAAVARRVSDFMTRMFKVSDPGEARGNSITAREILDKASKDIDGGLADDRQLQAQMMQTMGTVYQNLGLYAKAESLFRRAMEIRTALLGPKHRDTLASASSLANVLKLGWHLPEAEKLMRQTLDLQRRSFGSSDADTLLSSTRFANILEAEGRYPEAEKLDRETLDVAGRKYGPQAEVARLAQWNLAIDLSHEGKYSDAEKLFRDIYQERSRRLGDDDPSTLDAERQLAATLGDEERYPEAESVTRDCLARETRILGPEHPQTLGVQFNLALDVSAQNRDSEAEKLLRDALASELKSLGPDHRLTLVTMGALSETLVRERHYPEAEQVIRKVIDGKRRTLGPQHDSTLDSLLDLAEIQKDARHYQEAEMTAQEALDGFRRALGPNHPDTNRASYSLAEIQALQGKRDEALLNLDSTFAHQPPPSLLKRLESDEDLKSLHGDARFGVLVAKVRELLEARGKSNP